MIRHILITGGAGFIGSNLSLALLAKGHKVRVLDSLATQIHGKKEMTSSLYQSIAGKVDFIRGDVTSRQDLFNAMKGVDTIVHLAAETGTGQSMYAISRYVSVNVGGTALMLDLIANEKLSIQRIVIASSRAIYGEGKYQCQEHGVCFPTERTEERMSRGEFEPVCPLCFRTVEMLLTDENSALHPTSVYGVTKLTQEQLVMSVGKAIGISTIACRYQNVYGPGQSLSNPYTGILSIFSTRIRNGREINIFEDGLESRDFVYISDVVEATIAGIECPDPITDSFNVGSGKGTDVLTVANLLLSHFGGDSEIKVSGQYRAGDIRHNVADNSKILRILGYSPKVTIEEGLLHFVKWVKGECIEADLYEESIKEMRRRGLFK
ncbi:MAG: SDR family NAD(P)-dependent oxidoreductase [bacterium]